MAEIDEAPTHVVFIDQSGGPSSGAQESLALLLQALPRHIDKTVVLFQHGAYEQRLRREGHQIIVHPVSAALEGATRYGPHIRRSLLSGADVFSLVSLLRRLQPDLVHTNTVKAHLVGIPAARIANIQSVMHIRDTLTGGGRVALSTLGRFAADRTIAVSQHIAKWYAISRTDVIYNPIDFAAYSESSSTAEAREELDLPQGVPAIGIVGPVHEGKGHDRFLRIFAAVARETDAVGVIIGDARFKDNSAVDALRRLANDLGIVSRIRFIPWLEDPRPGYAALDIVVNCSTREPFGRSLAEAAACAKPSAMFSDCGVAELFVDDESAFMVAPYDENAFAKRLVAAINEPRTLTSIGERAKLAIQRLSLESHAHDVERAYRGLQSSRLLRQK